MKVPFLNPNNTLVQKRVLNTYLKRENQVQNQAFHSINSQSTPFQVHKIPIFVTRGWTKIYGASSKKELGFS